MSDRRVGYYKHLPLGDLMLAGHPELVAVVRPPEWSNATWANRATVSDRGASAYYRATLRTTLRRTPNGGPEETPREFMHRKIAWLRSITAAAGFGAIVDIYEPSGPLAIVEDRNAHVTTAVTDVPTGVGASFEIDDDIGLVNDGCWVYISDGVRAEVARVTDWDSGLSVVQTEAVLGAYLTGATVARVEWWLPEARIARDLRVPGNELGNYGVAKDIELVFESQQPPEPGL